MVKTRVAMIESLYDEVLEMRDGRDRLYTYAIVLFVIPLASGKSR